MKINEKQLNLLKKILVNYELKKNIYNLDTLEASVVIEGILNNGKVKPIYNNKPLSSEQARKKQVFFDSLVQKTFIKATDKQLRYVDYLSVKNNYILLTHNIPKSHISILINFLEKDIHNEIALKYLRKEKIQNKKELITIRKEHKEHQIKLPEDWVVEEIEINGILDF